MPASTALRSTIGLSIALSLAGGVAQVGSASSTARTKLFVIADSPGHKAELIAAAGAASVRMEFASSRNRAIFSGEFTSGQIRALAARGARFEPVEEIFPSRATQRFGYLFDAAGRGTFARPSARPVCGDGQCSGPENASTCPADCAGDGQDPSGGGRACAPMDQLEYQTLLTSGEVAATAGSGVRLFVIDTGTTPSHPDLDVAVCRNVTGRRVKNGCSDSLGHGTHTSGSAAANGGADGGGLFGAAPGATLGFIKICTQQCFSDALVRGIEEAVLEGADVISLSFGAADTTALHNAVLAAEDAGALFLAAAGNGGPTENSISYPAAYPEVVAVGILGADKIVTRMSARGSDDGNDGSIGPGEVELAGGGFVVESTWTDGCYEVLSGTSMSTPSIAGLAAAHWQGSAAATRAWLVSSAEDIANASLVPGYDPTTAGWDRVSGYGLPRTGAGTDGFGAVSVTGSSTTVPDGASTTLSVLGPPDSPYRIGVSSPSGDWTFGEFTTDEGGASTLTLTPWTDAGTWLMTVDFGGGKTSFGAAFDTFVQP